jgi:hypothetical protein
LPRPAEWARGDGARRGRRAGDLNASLIPKPIKPIYIQARRLPGTGKLRHRAGAGAPPIRSMKFWPRSILGTASRSRFRAAGKAVRFERHRKRTGGPAQISRLAHSRLGAETAFPLFRQVERGADLRAHLKRYAALPADFIKSHGGHRFVEDDRFGDPR